ncbi:siderophore-interacting protein [Streptomyces sp. NBC_00249]|uniref:SIP domain-containing protein n=1 Tax=Streptomyces sp. NBC_00249 TaxID=2975690 RepID=UPI00225A06A4|nr:SIP domain-containing protein [Streptomyces sp. NBC_00249]MCX5199408.1 siderophore-interacting protein [Streptomyces sp. NBC_00249]
MRRTACPSGRRHGDAFPASSAVLVDAVRDLGLPGEPGTAYVAGETRTVQLVRPHLVHERDRPRRSGLTTPFRTPGMTGMEWARRIRAARGEPLVRGVEGAEVQDMTAPGRPVVSYPAFNDPGGNGWTVQQLPG